jgi:hypothetical protein
MAASKEWEVMGGGGTERQPDTERERGFSTVIPTGWAVVLVGGSGRVEGSALGICI